MIGQAAGLGGGHYSLPDWVENPVGLENCLNQLLRYSPRTAIIFRRYMI